jgi:hypothetical protein
VSTFAVVALIAIFAPSLFRKADRIQARRIAARNED